MLSAKKGDNHIFIIIIIIKKKKEVGGGEEKEFSHYHYLFIAFSWTPEQCWSGALR